MREWGVKVLVEECTVPTVYFSRQKAWVAIFLSTLGDNFILDPILTPVKNGSTRLQAVFAISIAYGTGYKFLPWRDV